MLYATVICDLIYKLKELRDIYSDKGARQILEELERQQQSNPQSTDWEKDIPEKCKNGGKILTLADYSNFCSLQQLRHLCAHPVLGEEQKLYRPNSDIVMGHIRNMLEGVFVKPAFQARMLFDMFIKDVASIRNILVRNEEIKRYIESKYLNKFDNVELEYSLFKGLWKFVFKLSNEDCDANRKINLQVIRILVERHKDILLKKFEKDKEYFSTNIDESNIDLLRRFIKFANIHPEFFDNLTDAKKIQIEGIINQDTKHDLKALSIFKSDNAVRHIFNATFSMHKTAVYLASYLSQMAGRETACDYCVKLFAKSSSFDMADWRFEDLIFPNLQDFSIGQLTAIVKAVNENGQLFGRMQARSSNGYIRNRIAVLDKDFDYSPYPNFR